MARCTTDMGVVALRDRFGLTIAEANGLALLAQGGIVPLERIHDVYCDRPDSDIIEARQMVKRIRKKVRERRAPIRIYSHYGIGYELEPESKRIVRQIIREAR